MQVYILGTSTKENEMTKTFTSYEAAMAYYQTVDGTLSTVIPGKLWKVTVF
jgi:hypothetical protein